MISSAEATGVGAFGTNVVARADVRKRMAAVAAGLGARQIAVEMHEHRAGQVRRPIRALAGIDVSKIVPAVDDHEPRIVEMALERLGGDECREGHATCGSSSLRTYSWKRCIPSSIGDW